MGLLIAIGFAILLLLPSGLTALGGYREVVLVLYGAHAARRSARSRVGADDRSVALAVAISPVGSRPWPWTPVASFSGRSGPTILGIGCLVHVLTIVVIWSLGRAQGLLLPVSDAAILFTVMISVALVPISIGGWGLREVAVISLLGNHGVPPERALLFSVCFGLALAVGSLPGALAWLLYSFAPSRRSAEPGR